MRKFAFKPNIFPGVLTFFIGEWDRDQAMAHLRFQDIADTGDHIYSDPPSEGCMARCYYPEVGFPIMWLREPPHTPYQIGSMVHEIEHALMFYLNWLGLEHCRETTEIYAYMMDRITTGVLELVWHKNLCDGFVTFE